jgi:hypothetical protein
MQVHRGKVIGSGVGMTAGVLYGLANAKGKWGVVGFALAGTVLGGLVGGMIDSKNSGAMVQASEGDSNKSSFRGYRRGKMEINHPVPRSAKFKRRTGRRIMH